ncbi:hypothetical protein [Leptospira paudalimensis]|uniref:MAE-28990/MAE-18760-like HEPN domain-containing protein n=1 Tax=Leptospira paudalimensis TaxID=2950024 RepID=A0ABT3M6V0_9LEPT|nr:hypothetical protein [Leptospira paudalimensis]MCW7503899.1 hypothetical protein [Leptospira paudalimensis]
MKLSNEDEESLSYIYVLSNILIEAIRAYSIEKSQLNILNVNNWLMALFELFGDISKYFPSILQKSRLEGNTFGEFENNYTLRNLNVSIRQDFQLKLIRDKSFHGLQNRFKNKKNYNHLSWILLGRTLSKDAYFLELIDSTILDVLPFIEKLKAEICNVLGYDFSSRLKSVNEEKL